MEKQKRIRGFLASREGLKVLENKRLELKLTYEDIVSQAGLNSDDRVKRLFNPHWGIGIQRDGIEKIASVLNLNPADFIEGWYPKTKNKQQKMNIKNLDWPEVIKISLKQQQQKQQLRRRATEKGFEVNVFVPLGLVERKEQQRRSGAIEKDQINQLKEEVIIKNYTHDEFLIDVIKGQNNNNNQHLAIIGEAGAGKTTYLDKIASFIHQETEDLAIFIPLASLQGRNIKDYLINEWLPEAFYLVYPDLEIEEKQEKDFQKWLRKSNIWLLLDGLDEMGIGTKSIEEISQQLTNWLANVRVIISCRPNVWDAKVNHSLNNFSIYKTQEFNQNDIHRFIDDWFIQANKIDQGNQLKHKLEQSQHQQIYQLITNPLRLSLLCQIFYQNPNFELPETRAELYQQFVNYFYEWKPNQVEIDWTTQPNLQNDLHLALGKLSIAGLESETLFRLPLSLIKEKMSDDLFKIAWEIGWLNLVDRDEKTNEPVYAFFHPSFQEYFAALAVGDDYKFFLNHIPENPLDEKASYRVFDNPWKDIVLLWIEIPTINLINKEQFINDCFSFSQFNDQFFNQLNFLLCPILLKYCYLFDNQSFYALLNYLFKALVNPIYFDDEMNQFVIVTKNIYEYIINFLKDYNIQIIEYTREYLKSNSDKESKFEILEILFSLDIKDNQLIEIVSNLLDVEDDISLNLSKHILKIKLSKYILKYDHNNKFALEYLQKSLIKENDEFEYCDIDIIEYLIKIHQTDEINEIIVNKIINLLNSKNSLVLVQTIALIGIIINENISIIKNKSLQRKIFRFCFNNQDNIDELIFILNIITNKVHNCFDTNELIKFMMILSIYILTTKGDELQKVLIIQQIFIYYKQIDFNLKIPNETFPENFSLETYIQDLLNILKQDLSPDELAYIFIFDILENIIIKYPETFLNINNLLQLFLIEMNYASQGYTKLWERLFLLLIKASQKNNIVLEFFKNIEYQKLPQIESLDIAQREIITEIFKNFISNIIQESAKIINEYEDENKQLLDNTYDSEFDSYLLSNKNKLKQIINNHNNINIEKYNYYFSLVFSDLSIHNLSIEDHELIDNIIKIIFDSEDKKLRINLLFSLDQINIFEEEIFVKKIITYFLKSSENIETELCLLKINNINSLKILVNNCSQNLSNGNEIIQNFGANLSLITILFHCCQNLPFPEFYQAWYSNNKNIHPEMKEITPVGETEITKQFNQQLQEDIYTQLKTQIKQDHINLVMIKGSKLQKVKDSDKLAKAINNQIFKEVSKTPPQIKDIFDLERELINLKLETDQDLLLIINNCDPVAELIELFEHLIEEIYIIWLTDQPFNGELIKSNHFRTFKPDQTNLTDIIQNWIDGIK